MTRVPVLTERDGRAELVEVEVGRSEASLAGRFWSAGYTRFLETGDMDVLAQFEGTRIGGLQLATDPDAVEDFYFVHGHVDFQEYYKS